MEIAVREMAPAEADLVVDYFHQSTPEQLEMLGVAFNVGPNRTLLRGTRVASTGLFSLHDMEAAMAWRRSAVKAATIANDLDSLDQAKRKARAQEGTSEADRQIADQLERLSGVQDRDDPEGFRGT